MNESDTEIISSILSSKGYSLAEKAEDADIVFANTCAIRENAETKIWNKINSYYKNLKKQNPQMVIGILGCMAEWLKEQIVSKETAIDIVAGPDSYRDLPNLIQIAQSNFREEEKSQAINVQLSQDETYADIKPVRRDPNRVAGWVSIMRGCNNMCSFCIVPFTRGWERSRPLKSIEEEVIMLWEEGFKEITLLG